MQPSAKLQNLVWMFVKNESGRQVKEIVGTIVLTRFVVFNDRTSAGSSAALCVAATKTNYFVKYSLSVMFKCDRFNHLCIKNQSMILPMIIQ